MCVEVNNHRSFSGNICCFCFPSQFYEASLPREDSNLGTTTKTIYFSFDQFCSKYFCKSRFKLRKYKFINQRNFEENWKYYTSKVTLSLLSTSTRSSWSCSSLNSFTNSGSFCRCSSDIFGKNLKVLNACT